VETLRIIVVHEYGALNHYTALKYFCDNNNYELKFHEFGITPQIKAIIKKNRLKNLRRFFSNLCFLLRRLISNKRNEIIILGVAPLDLRLALLLWIFRNNKVYIHNSWPEWQDGQFPKGNSCVAKKVWTYALKNNIAGFFAVSRKTYREFINYFCFDKYNSEVVYHSLKQGWLMDEAEIILKEKKRHILFMGRLVKEKGLVNILKIAKACPRYTFHIIGDGPDSYVLKNQKNIIIHGHLSELEKIKEIVDRCSFLLQPSISCKGWKEAFGLTVIEAMSRGIPVIATNQPGPLEIIDNKQGFIFTEETYLSCAIEVIDTLDYETWKKMSLASYNRAKDFTIDKLSEKWGNLLDE
jgi:glycosyltransferase involved in cell wall biosynthesis